MSAARGYEAPDLADMVCRVARALVRRAEAGEVEVLDAICQIQDACDVALGDAARALNEGALRLSWAEIGAEVGLTRQAAHKAFSRRPLVDVSAGA